MNSTTKLRELIASRQIARLAGAHDPLSASLVEISGFDGVWASSFTISAANGLPDMSLLSMADFLEAAGRMAAVCSVPILADCDTGFGGAPNVAYLVQRYEAAGVAGVCIEDKVFPKTNSFVDRRQELLAVDEFARKIEAGKNAQRDPDFVLVARTEALIAGHDVQEALHRAHAYVDAGADVILVHSKKDSPREVIEFLDAWQARAPVVVVPTTYHDWHFTDAESSGVSLVIYANHALRAAVRSMYRVLTSIESSGTSTAVEDLISPVSEVFELTHLDKWLHLEKR
ncbi:isocitrate lyase/phosphoenolpyruvate mutase family protein [Streptomyces sp. NBC_00878]|uniref:isocitrate lyase/phosphoenolpyruvate mutase family protein n=1 Tax=Streptomyces sp. NBC_00878 TaxID=2975854 RepID=UPI00225794A8|nr:isocitrate lyase/phosphoenolpyruvate mutase family protein [Streptomyces sp. NBC_00878]MCX4902785.1 isocitrate lyase/phosphoenolpyruvate mutase family protein [Streptomyces sp. NBC_00878]